jgi:molybdate transport system regulatory protein
MINLNFWIDKDNKSFLGKGRIKLLKLIDKYGSISKAAKEMKMSYKAAWDAVDIINSLSQKPVVEKQSGGIGGGGTYLTEYGKKLIKNFDELENEIEQFKYYLNEKYKDKF